MNINPLYLKQSAKIARIIGASSDWVQGGGGNFSIKIDQNQMLIKASGLALKDVDAAHGLVLVDYTKVGEYYNSLSKKKVTVQVENLSNQAILEFTNNFLPGQNLKASIETGFHSFLKKYAVHSHSVYANIINCSINPEKLLGKIFARIDFEYLVVQYCSPGLSLAREIKSTIDLHIKNGGVWPEVIFLQNHGILINTDNFDRSLKLYIQVDRLIKKYFKINLKYPKVSVKKNNNCFESNTKYLKKYFKNVQLTKNLFQPVLFPDQVVYLNSDIVDKNSTLYLGNKFFIDKKTCKLVYNTNLKESLTIEETIVAYCYIKEKINKYNLKLKTVSDDDVDFINNMESEKYRQKLLKV